MALLTTIKAEPKKGRPNPLEQERVVIFGGRGDDILRPHNPKTYRIEEVNGTLEFATYETRDVRESEKHENGTEKPSMVPSALLFNDVWQYNMDCERWADYACNGTDYTWAPLDTGSINGGCRIVMGVEVCTHPSERWLHRAEIFQDSTMLIYGGFSHRCEDYCDDMWRFNFGDNSWTEIMPLGRLLPKDQQIHGPGKRWMSSTVGDGKRMYFFGGHRLWHGFAEQNSEDNFWKSFEQYSKGGYLDDIWIYDNEEGDSTKSWRTREKLVSTYDDPGDPYTERHRNRTAVHWPDGRCGHTSVLHDHYLYIFGGYRTFFPYPSTDSAGAGQKISGSKRGFTPYHSYKFYMNDLWRFDLREPGTCLTCGYWEELVPPEGAKVPDPRVGHAMVRAHNIIYLYGGYADNYYYDDTWQYNITSNRWLHQTQFVHALFPENCTDSLEHRQNLNPEHDKKAQGDVYDLHGGLYKGCCSCLSGCIEPKYSDIDIPYEGEWHSGLYLPDPPRSVAAGAKSSKPSRGFRAYVPIFISYEDYRRWGLEPGSKANNYDDASQCQIIEADEEIGADQCMDTFYKGWDNSWKNPHPFAASPQTRERPYFYVPQNHYGTGLEFFTVVASPTRPGNGVKIVEGYEGIDVRIKQPRRQAPGWDGCRDRVDGRTGVPNELQWLHPSQRAWHQMIYSEVNNTEYDPNPRCQTPPCEPKLVMQDKGAKFHRLNRFMIVYGGYGFNDAQPKLIDKTPASSTLQDMWHYAIDQCPKNCSMHGDCIYGHCYCHDGYYGIDCSNSSCPGDYCYYDADRVQHCTHCCSATYKPRLEDTYLQDERKIPCSQEHPGEAHGLCDGFGQCQCAPPMITEDCSVRDCKKNCSGHGYCSVEYPVSRCTCDSGWTGLLCDYQLCLNNCSYPNGVCLNGSCFCAMTYSPYNRTRLYYPWQGYDCSWRIPYAAAGRALPLSWWVLTLTVGIGLAVGGDMRVDMRYR
jgi:hypothetical protein